jgi:hypothetical protein
VDDAMEIGRLNESVTNAQYTSRTGIVVTPCGLFLNDKYGFLGASPDGRIGDTGIVEVKCLYAFRDCTPIE